MSYHDPQQPLMPGTPGMPVMPGAGQPYGPPPPRSRKALWIVLGAVGVVILMCVGGAVAFVGIARDAANDAAQKPATVTGPSGGGGAGGGGATQGPVTAAVGQTITVRPWRVGEDGEVAYTVRAVTKAEPPNEYIQPAKGMFVTVDLEIRVTRGSEFAAGGDISFVARDGTVYEATYAGFPDEFDSAELKEGQRKSGLVAFDVPDDALDGAKIQLRSLFDDDAYGYWTV
jgi:hypothetical protein